LDSLINWVLVQDDALAAIYALAKSKLFTDNFYPTVLNDLKFTGCINSIRPQ